jgi:hypothetical protein
MRELLVWVFLGALVSSCRRDPPQPCVDEEAMRTLVEFADPSFKLDGYAVCGSRAASINSEPVVEAIVLVKGSRDASRAWLPMALNRVDRGVWSITDSYGQPAPGVRSMAATPSDADISKFARDAAWIATAPAPAAGCATKVAREIHCQ